MPQVFWIGDVCDADWREKFMAELPITAKSYFSGMTVEAAIKDYEKAREKEKVAQAGEQG